MARKAYDRKKASQAKTEQEAKNEGLHMVDFFFDSVVYDIVTWVAIAFCVGCTLIYFFKTPRSLRGVFWSLIALTICILIMIAVRVDQHFFRPVGATKGSVKSEGVDR